jgi:intracellular multiplication protein IcmL
MQSNKSLDADIKRMAKNSGNQDDTRSMFRSMVTINIILMVVVIALVLLVCVERFTRRPIEYFARSIDGRIMRLVPLSEPMATNVALFAFGDEALQASFVLDFKNHFTQIANAEPFYTPDGYQEYKKVLDIQGYLQKIIKESRVSSISRHGGWVLTDQKIINGVLHQRIEAPVYLVLSGKDGDITSNLIAVLNIARVVNVDNPRGIAVASFLLVTKN